MKLKENCMFFRILLCHVDAQVMVVSLWSLTQVSRQSPVHVTEAARRVQDPLSGGRPKSGRVSGQHLPGNEKQRNHRHLEPQVWIPFTEFPLNYKPNSVLHFDLHLTLTFIWPSPLFDLHLHLTFILTRDEDTQTVALKIVHAILRYLAPAELLFLLPSVTAFTSASSAPCRAVMYDILMWVYDNYRYVIYES